MNLQQAVYPRSSTNSFVKRKVHTSSGTETKLQPGNSYFNGVIRSGITSVSKGASSESLARDRLEYFTTCLIGHHVDVQVKNGSMYSGIFHATSADGDFGIILKMALLTKEVSFRGQKLGPDSASKAPSKTLIIPAHELVQVVAKDVPVTRDGLSNEFQGENLQEIMLDSYISQSNHVDVGRELKPWVPDEDAPQHPELENIFDSTWTGRSWDQFKVNEALFGVKSTFNEELYTTKLDKGSRTRELEVEASRIAREIEGEDTYDLHLAEERGAFPHANFDLDEETKYSSVFRGFDDSGCADEDVILNSHDIETFGESSGPGFIRSSSVSRRDGYEQGGVSSVMLTSSTVCTMIEEKTCSGDLSVDKCPNLRVIEPRNSHRQPGSSGSSTYESGATTQAPSAATLSPSSSLSSLSSEQSTLNPNAKEFRLNSKAKSFVPPPSLLKPASPVNDTSFYFPSTVSMVPHVHGVPVDIGNGQSFGGHQPATFNPQAAAMQSQQAYYAANGPHPQYGQHMIHGHPSQVMYWSGYPEGREF